jgi:hypothetical protein
MLIGTAAASLVGLTFVALSITQGYMTEEFLPGQRIFMAPILIQFVNVFVASLILIAPLNAVASGACVLVCGIAGVAHAAWVLHRSRKLEERIASDDQIFYIFGPLVCYLAVIAGAALVALREPASSYVLAVAILLLLLLTIRNVWDLMVWAVIRSSKPK